MKKGIAAACALLLLAATAAGGEADPGRDRNWAVGWEDGVTLRRAFGVWDLSVAAGPDDWLNESQEYRWNSEWPDSLQGTVGRDNEDRRESGFVRLGVARELAAWEAFSLHGTLSGLYSWSNASTKWRSYDTNAEGYDLRLSNSHADEYEAALGFRIAWRPRPFLALQVRFGVVLASEDQLVKGTDYDAYSERTVTYEEPRQWTRFYSYGSRGANSIEFFVWF